MEGTQYKVKAGTASRLRKLLKGCAEKWGSRVKPKASCHESLMLLCIIQQLVLCCLAAHLPCSGATKNSQQPHSSVLQPSQLQKKIKIFLRLNGVSCPRPVTGHLREQCGCIAFIPSHLKFMHAGKISPFSPSLLFSRKVKGPHRGKFPLQWQTEASWA